jgi:hypothetical protein
VSAEDCRDEDHYGPEPRVAYGWRPHSPVGSDTSDLHRKQVEDGWGS